MSGAGVANANDVEIGIDAAVEHLCATLRDYNTHVTRLEFIGRQLDPVIATQLQQLLDQNKAIREVRQYLNEHPPVWSDEMPLEVLMLMADQLIVQSLRRGHTREQAQQALDDFLLNARGRSLQEASRIPGQASSSPM